MHEPVVLLLVRINFPQVGSGVKRWRSYRAAEMGSTYGSMGVSHGPTLQLAQTMLNKKGRLYIHTLHVLQAKRLIISSVV